MWTSFARSGWTWSCKPPPKPPTTRLCKSITGRCACWPGWWSCSWPRASKRSELSPVKEFDVNRYLKGWPYLLPAALLLAGCGRDDSPPNPAADGNRYLLKAEPSGARAVKAVRQEARDGDEVVV